MPALHPMAAAVVRRALAARDDQTAEEVASFWLSAWGDIAELDGLARRVDMRHYRDVAALVDAPLAVGNATLRRLSIGADVWLSDLAPAWFAADDGSMPILVIAWAMAHGRDPDAIRRASDAESARAEIVAWSRSLTCSDAELASATRALMAEWADPLAKWTPKSDDPAAPLSSAVAMLTAETGLPADHWLWAVSREEFFDVCGSIAGKVEAEVIGAAKAAKRPPPASTHWARAQWAFNRASRAFMAAHAPRKD